MAAQDMLHAAIHVVVLALEAAAAATVVAGAAVGLWTLVKRGMAAARHAFGNCILLALDFTIGADLLKVSTVPDLVGLAIVGGVVLVRIVLTVVLVWEVRSEERDAPRPPGKIARRRQDAAGPIRTGGRQA